MSEDQMLKCLIAFVLGFLVGRMMRGNGLSVGGKDKPKNDDNICLSNDDCDSFEECFFFSCKPKGFEKSQCLTILDGLNTDNKQIKNYICGYLDKYNDLFDAHDAHKRQIHIRQIDNNKKPNIYQRTASSAIGENTNDE